MLRRILLHFESGVDKNPPRPRANSQAQAMADDDDSPMGDVSSSSLTEQREIIIVSDDTVPGEKSM